MSKTRPFGADRCPNCGEYGAHYAGPSLGEPGFFICKKKPDKLIPKMRESGREWFDGSWRREGEDNVTTK